ncbi:MAG: nitrogen fixation protein NifZ [Sulfuritalea sp.]|nr:nitrogen fixation protein NifZ [Sulfuritalea sp.]MDP1983753.1 nitrogen fixation protein NifZ [Sulfuritalea sp.]
MLPRWDQGDAVRVTRNVRNDGTFPGVEIGELLVRRGRVGHVRSVGTFLQDQIIYSVHFLDEARVIGCREEELIGQDEPWIENRFEVRQKVRAARALAIRGEVRVPLGSRGEVLNLERDETRGVLYHVHFDCLPGNPLLVPEASLQEPGDE